MSEEVDVRPILFGDRLDLRVRSPKHMLPPAVILKGDELHPSLKVLILPLDHSCLPLLVSSKFTVSVISVVAMNPCLLLTLWCMVHFEIKWTIFGRMLTLIASVNKYHSVRYRMRQLEKSVWQGQSTFYSMCEAYL